MPTRSSACATPRPVSRVSSDESSTSRGCSAPCATCRGGEVERAGQLGRNAQRVVGAARRRTRGSRGRASRPRRNPGRDTPTRRAMPVAIGAASAGCARSPRSGARARRRAAGRAPAAGRGVNSLTATRRSLRLVRAKDRARAYPRRSDEAHETARTRQVAQRRQRPCAAGTPPGRRVMVTLKIAQPARAIGVLVLSHQSNSACASLDSARNALRQ